jgi:NTE family protein
MQCRRTLAVLLALAGSLEAQDRPKIGLVLEGGGAKGLAHIGVIRWLENNRIPVDYVGGTSMGGLVAGLYATGKTAAELEEFAMELDWNAILSGQIPYRDLIYRRKEDRRQYPTLLEFGLRNGFSLPSGIESGQNVGLLFDDLALPYHSIEKFDDLPIPFRCVATEITQAKAKVFEGGSLSEALRATMAIPGVFTPVKRDDLVFVDGGLLENLPVDVVRKMGADVVIAVHLEGPPYSPRDISSPLGTLGRSISVVIAVNELRSREKADILIIVPVEEIGTMDFTKIADIIPLGFEAPDAKAPLLKKFSVSEAEYAAWRKHVESRRIREIPTPEFLEITGTRPEVAESIREELGPMLNQPIDTSALDRELIKVSGVGRFSKLDYSVVTRDGKTGLVVRAEEKEHAPPTILPAVLLNGSDWLAPTIALGARTTWLDVGSYRTEIRTDFIIGGLYFGAIEYYRPFQPTSKWFIAPQGVASSEVVSVYDRGGRVAEFRESRAGGAIDIGHTQTRFSEFRAGYRLYHNFFARRIGDPDLPRDLRGTTGVTSGRFVLDRLDDGIVPREGHFSRSRVEYWDKNVGGTKGFPLIETDFLYFRPVSRPGSLTFRASGGTTFGDSGVGLPVFRFGGMNRMSAYGTNEFFTNQYWYGQTGYIHELGRLPLFAGRRIFGVFSAEILKPFGNQTTRLAANGVLGALAETVIGPLFLGGAYGESGHRKIYFQIGRFF